MIVDISGTGTGNKYLFPFFTCTAHEVRVDLCDALRKTMESHGTHKKCALHAKLERADCVR